MNNHVSRVENLRSVLRIATASLLVGFVAGCGGGLYVDATIAEGPPPDISLATASTVAFRGEPVHLVAAVAASNGIDYVSFYRLDYGVPTLLGSVGGSPIQWDTSIPINAGSNVSYFALACDRIGKCTDSQLVTIAVYP